MLWRLSNSACKSTARRRLFFPYSYFIWESTVFWLDAVNAKGQRAEDVFAGMTKGGEALNESDPENPINYMRAALANRDVLVDWIRNTPRRIEVEIKGKRLLIREDATDADKKEIIQNL